MSKNWIKRLKGMKKIAIALAAMMAALSFASCNKEAAPEKEAVPEEVQPVKPRIKFNITVGGGKRCKRNASHRDERQQHLPSCRRKL
jgi:hypothetical protein